MQAVIDGMRIKRTGTQIGPGAEVDADAVNGNVFRNRRHQATTLLLVRNADSQEHNLSVEVGRIIDGVQAQPRVRSVPANTALIAGPWTGDYEQAVGAIARAVVVLASSDQLKLQVLYLQKE